LKNGASSSAELGNGTIGLKTNPARFLCLEIERMSEDTTRCFVVTVVCMLPARQAVAQQVASSQAAASAGGLCIIEASESRSPAGSPLLLRTTLKNTADKPLWLAGDFGPGSGTFRLEIMRPGSDEWKRLWPAGIPMSGWFHSESLEPGGTRVTYVLLLIEASSSVDKQYHRFVLHAIGRYQFRLRLRYRDGELLSEPVTVDVGPPDRTVEAVMNQLHKQESSVDEFFDEELRAVRTGLGGLSLLEGSCTPETLEFLQARVGQVKEYQPVLSLGKALALARSKNPSQREQGIAQLEALRSPDKPALWRGLAAEHLTVAYARAGQSDKAVRLLREIGHVSEWTRQAKAIIEDARRASQPHRE
jgi:hypothetical protein